MQSFDEYQSFPSQESQASLLSRLTFQWFMPILKLSQNKPLEMHDIWDLLNEDKSEYNHKQYEKIHTKDTISHKLLILLKPLLKQQVVVGVASSFLTLINPLALHYLLTNFKGPVLPLVICLFVMTLSSIINSLLHGRAYFLGRRIGTRVRAILISEIFSHALKVRLLVNQDTTTHGEIVNLMSIDTQKVLEYTCYMHYLFTTPLQIVICTIALYSIIGISSFVCIAIILFIVPIQHKLAKYMQYYQKKLLISSDERINKLNEMLNSIKVIKYFSWEDRFQNAINKIRSQELKALKQFRFIMAVVDVVYQSIPIVIPVLTFSLFSIDHQLTPSNVFPSMALLQILRHPLRDLPDQIIKYLETKVSMDRITQFLNKPTIQPYPITHTIQIKQALINKCLVSIEIPNNEFTVIIGSTNSGKTSLLYCLLNEIPCSISLPPFPISYCSQQPWLYSGTIRRNILFFSEFNQTRYEKALHDACLLQDLQELPYSDFTSVNDLSGGQKQRVSLARAFYHSNPILLLDDCLSAVDSITQHHLLQSIKHQPATRILVTHSTQLVLPHCSAIINCTGTSMTISHQEPLQTALNGQVRLPLKPYTLPENNEEFMQNGQTHYKVYLFYMSTTILLWILLCSGEFINHFLRVSQDIWLNKWSMSSDDDSYYIYMYIVLSCSTILFTFSFQVIEYHTAIKSSKRLFDQLLYSILHVKIHFYDSTPIGRIVNRFSRDIQVLDRNVSNSLLNVLYCTLGTFIIILMILYIAPLFIFGMIPICYCYYYISKYYLSCSRELKRLESIHKSPIYTLFSEILNGSNTIRAYKKEHALMKENYNKIDYYQRAFFYLWVSNRWLGIRTECLGAFIVFASGLAIICTIGSTSPELAGLCMSYSFTFTDQILWMIRYNSELEMNLNSVERIKEYVDLEQEQQCGVDVQEWPSNGQITVDNLSICYGQNLVLKSISFKINGGEKIGIVGRTGAGKSTLASAFFRFIDDYSGSICIDGINIKEIKLKWLRSQLTMIPQDPALFMGTIRLNLDPFEEYDDALLNQILIKSQLTISLDDKVTENGKNLSVGTRQQLNLGRALLRQSKVILLDEATANIDAESDEKIQKMIKTAFVDSTILCIAHRLRTIIDFDRILVLDKGKVVEFDSPSQLLKSKSFFYQMCLESHDYDYLTSILA